MPNMGLINNKNYCNQADIYNLNNPNNIFKQKNFITDYNTDGLARELVMKKIGNDLMPDYVSKDMNKTEWNLRKYSIPVNGNIIFTKKVKFHYFHEYNKNLFCLFQMYNHLPGNGVITRKDLVVNSIKKYSSSMLNKTCFDKDSFFPQTFRLDNQTECR